MKRDCFGLQDVAGRDEGRHQGRDWRAEETKGRGRGERKGEERLPGVQLQLMPVVAAARRQ